MLPPWSKPRRSSDLAACRALLQAGSRTFYAASHALPGEIADRATALYAFCRLADDAIDLGSPAAALPRLRRRLDRIYAGRPMAFAADRAFAEVARRFGIPRAMPDALLEGFEWDAAGRRYDTLDELIAYATRVAGTVGAMMSLLMEARAPVVLARACELGVAMQLTNICRDVGEDARAGRLYLPLEWLREAGIDPAAWLAAPAFTPALGGVVQRVLDAGDVLYARAATGIGALPAGCRPGMHAARMLYAEIGREVERRALDSVSGRAVVPASRKTAVLAGALLSALHVPRVSAEPALAQTQFLIDSVVHTPASQRAGVRAPIPWWDLEGRIAGLIDIFDKLERGDGPRRESAGQPSVAREPDATGAALRA
jgi:phytoene synthase